MEEKKHVPELRFAQFDKEWKGTALADVATFSKGKGVSKAEIVPDGLTECIRYGELYTHYRETIDIVKSRTNVPTDQLVLSAANDVIIPASGETQADIATASCVLRSGIALGGDLNIIRTVQNGVFLAYYLNSRLKGDIANLAQGISVVHLYSSQLRQLKLNLPSLPEQQKIASFFTTIDTKISQLREKKEQLEAYKKGVMQQLFSRSLRFRDEEGRDYPDWEEKRLGEVAERVTQKNIHGNRNVLTISAQFGLVSQLDFFSKSVAGKNLNGYYLLQRDDFAYNRSYSNGYPMGAVKRLIGYDSGIVSTLYICFRLRPNVFIPFVEQYFESGVHNSEIEKVAQEGARNHGLLNVGISDFFSTQISLPSLPEQQKIASFLSALDEKIGKVQEQITAYEVWKKGLLQRMFV